MPNGPKQPKKSRTRSILFHPWTTYLGFIGANYAGEYLEAPEISDAYPHLLAPILAITGSWARNSNNFYARYGGRLILGGLALGYGLSAAYNAQIGRYFKSMNSTWFAAQTGKELYKSVFKKG